MPIDTNRKLNQIHPQLRLESCPISYFDGIYIWPQLKMAKRTVSKEVGAKISYLRHNDNTIFTPSPLPCCVVLSLEDKSRVPASSLILHENIDVCSTSNNGAFISCTNVISFQHYLLHVQYLPLNQKSKHLVPNLPTPPTKEEKKQKDLCILQCYKTFTFIPPFPFYAVLVLITKGRLGFGVGA
jgi:hypothetical protein